MLAGQMRDRLAPRLLELARKLEGSPTPIAIAMVRDELARLGRG